MSKRVITFAGVPGSSKTPIAYYLSWNLSLPILNNDAVRTEVREDVGSFDLEEYTRRRDERIRALLDSGTSFIYDASVDRSWEEFKKELGEAGYTAYIINMELSRAFVERLYASKGYQDELDTVFRQHQEFVEQFSEDISLTIEENHFHDRLEIALSHAREWVRQE